MRTLVIVSATVLFFGTRTGASERSDGVALEIFGAAMQDAPWPEQKGWPVQLPDLFAPESIQPVVVDLDGDLDMEVVVLTMHDLRVLRPEGAMYPGDWPFEFPVDLSTANLNLAIANVDNDADLEILFSRSRFDPPDPLEVTIYAFNCDGSHVDGWPRTMLGRAERMVVSDLDADGTNEILVGTSWELPRLYVLRSDGEPFGSEWPRDFEFWVRSLATADLDGDGDLEIVLNDGLADPPNLIHALHHDGVEVTGWPFSAPERVERPIVVGDVDGNGSPEIAFSVTESLESLVFLLNSEGEPLNDCWPVSLPPAQSYWSLAMGDVNGDGYPDIVTSGRTPQVFAIDRFGSILPGWPATIPFPFPGPNPYQNIIHTVADVDADGMPEVVVGALIGPCIFNHDGTPLPGAVPLQVELPHTSARLPLTVAVADVDSDGDVELFSGIWRTLYAWDFPGPECSVQWPRSSGNLGNTGAVTAPAVDISEWVLFNTCLTGPGAGPILPECICLDADNDADIDLHDFGALQRVFE